MDEAELILLYDYYGALLPQRQSECFELRYNADLSMGEIGEALGISRGIVAKLETGITPPSKTLLLLLSSKFNVDMDWLETGEGSPYGAQMVPELVEALRSYPDLLNKFNKLLPRMTVDDLNTMAEMVRNICDGK